eukprot:NODE_1077_length_1480_cov_71.868441_g1066_i0.p1 GENE.NODE_1077_length_1480_cov_71.868441_g1066_i0~~NODE_1077_length_1480_cov_71.868441_g1066_i0.p1  ORF type:complete len:456 (+),score=65.22 NODE_1077_length_1480_cov_71.868441_g1066_i0:81-1448(+)
MASFYARYRHKAPGNPDKELFNGYGLDSLEYNIAALKDNETPLQNKNKCLTFFLGQLTNSDTRCRAVRFGLISSLNWLVAKQLGPVTDALVCKSFRLLCATPPTVYSVYRNNGIESLLAVLGRGTDSKECLPAREASCAALLQCCAMWDTKRLLLGGELPEGMVSTDMEADDGKVQLVEKELREKLGRRVVEALSGVITSYNTGGSVSTLLLQHAVHSLAQMSSEVIGLELCLMVGVLREADDLLRMFSSHPSLWSGGAEEGVVLEHLLTVVWNLCMDPLGKRKPETMDSIPFCLGKVLLVAVRRADRFLKLKSAAVGALSAIYIYEKVKGTAVAPLLQPADAPALGVDEDTYTDVAEVCVDLLRQANTMLSAVRSGNVHEMAEDMSEDLVLEHTTAMVKNTVQALRLICELPAARTRVAVLIGPDSAVCLQLFRGTPIEKEMVESCGVGGAAGA